METYLKKKTVPQINVKERLHRMAKIRWNYIKTVPQINRKEQLHGGEQLWWNHV